MDTVQRSNYACVLVTQHDSRGLPSPLAQMERNPNGYTNLVKFKMIITPVAPEVSKALSVHWQSLPLTLSQ